MPGVQDSAFKAKDKREQQRQESRQPTKDWVERELELCWLVSDDNNCTNVFAQMGKVKTVQELEDIIKKLNPQLSIERRPGLKGRVMWTHSDPKGKGVVQEQVMLCDAGVMPEFSIMQHVKVEIPNMVDHFDADTPAVIYDSRPGEELCRGWRTILVRLVQAGLARPADVERLVGSADRRSWAAHMGKSNVTTLL